MRYFLDTEFIEDGKTIDLISIGIVSENGKYFYAENNECDLEKASPWVKENVLPGLVGAYDGRVHMPHKAIQNSVQRFITAEKSEFWAYYGAYDWVVFCQLFGKMIDLPKGYPMYCNDVKQLCNTIGNPKLPEQLGGKHNALEDAIWCRDAYNFCTNYAVDKYLKSLNTT